MSTYAIWREQLPLDTAWRAPIHTGRALLAKSYRLGKVLGRGDYGDLHLGTHVETQDRVAVRVVKLPASATGMARAAYEGVMRRELELLTRLSHPNIVAVIEAFEPAAEDEAPVFATVYELVEGCDLQAAVDAHGALPLETVRAIGAQLVSAVEYMHANGVVHRAIEPANIIALGFSKKEKAHADETVRIKLLGLGRALGLGEQFVRAYCQDLIRRVSARQTPILSWADELRDAVVGRATTSLTAASGASTQSSPRPPRVDGGSSASASDDGAMPRVAAEPSRYEFQLCAPARPPSGARGVYSAPEVHDRRRFRPTRGPAGGLSLVVDATVVIDAFSVGAVLSHLLTGVPPCDKVADGIARETTGARALLRRIASACAGRPPRRYRYMAELREVDGHDLVRLLGALMDKDPATRMTITQLSQHPWLAGESADEVPAMTPRDEVLAGVRE